ncbi:hypothetical protein FBZ98_1011034 [Rhizobium sp. ERR 922]|uniref:hypothetical protein n=1 Tax=unclassified Rhizobium TaxID=2613769 RepID=UPI0011A45B0C|nr:MULTISPECIES: hypothetical protein [unclassified Rhizobium]TWB61689.1 hypothetical protein FBZ98_1011034 [Rhizobium sp. ERR 922]TWC04615.1 hypothetical protein FBZ97_1011034 [Rhizobium sp. ERR 942]
MANALYTRLQATAKRLIEKYGQNGVVKRVTPPDPILGGDGTVTPYAAKLVPMSYEQRYVDGTTILANDRQIYISSVGLAVVPQVGDIVSAGDVDYHVVDADPNNYDGVTNVVFIVQGRIV